MKIEIHPVGVVRQTGRDPQKIEIYEDFSGALEGSPVLDIKICLEARRKKWP